MSAKETSWPIHIPRCLYLVTRGQLAQLIGRGGGLSGSKYSKADLEWFIWSPTSLNSISVSLIVVDKRELSVLMRVVSSANKWRSVEGLEVSKWRTMGSTIVLNKKGEQGEPCGTP